MVAPTSLGDGRYQLIEPLGEGGMATVYRAYDERLQVYRAIKLLSPAMAMSSKIRERFVTEARTMARLQHPHIVAVHDVIDAGSQPFMVMELVEGGSLEEHVEAHGPMPPAMACGLLLRVLDGLEAAHDAGVIHRDIKPHNILVTAKGKPKLTDFGIARLDEGAGLTKTGSVMGTWGFMAPEQRIDARKVDVRSDLYAVGATLYRLVTGEQPVDLFASELDDRVLGALPPDVGALIRHATRFKPEERFATAEEMQAAMASLLERLPPAPPDHPAPGASAKPRDAAPPPSPGMTMVPEMFDGDLLSSETSSSSASPTPRVAPTLVADEAVGGGGTLGDGGFFDSDDTGLEGGEDEVSWDTDRRASRRRWAVLALALLIGGGGGWWMASRSAGPEPSPPAVVDVAPVPEPAPPPTEPTVEPPPPEPTPEPVVAPVTPPAEAPTPPVATPPSKPVAPPAAPQPARLTLEGDALKVILRDPSGAARPLEALPAGTYEIRAAFSDGVPVFAGRVTVAEGQRAALTCSEAFQICKLK
ncbi:MAG: serine/threonine protein kinase [Alphaproteobacteria bacterium]|nr:serine/threonine protein kinase [Alphaproteobacteria bacterium]